MSLLSTVERAIKSCKAEQARMNERILFYREILQSLKSQPNTASEDSNSADPSATETSAGEKEDLELLERALEKALWVRTGTGHPTKAPNKQSAPKKEPHTSVVPPKEGRQTSAASRGKQTTGSTSRSGRFDRKEQKNSGGATAGTSRQQAARKSQQPVSALGSLGPGQSQTSGLCSKEKSPRSDMLRSDDLSKSDTLSRCTSNSTMPASHTTESAARSSPQQNGISSDQVAQWKSLRRKTNRLWEKVAALQRKPVPGRSHFMERMRATFPEDWPRGSPDQTRARLNTLTHQGCDLTQCYHTEELLAKQTSEAATELGSELRDKLQVKAAELRKLASQVKQEWEAWDQWRPEGGCLCPTGASGTWGDGRIAPLPPTVTYTTEAEIREMETLRIKVALLQQEIILEQALSDILSPQLSSIVPGRGCPDISVLRDVYSLLGEGGRRFPAIVLDSEAQ